MKKFLENNEYYKNEKGNYIKILGSGVESGKVRCLLMVINKKSVSSCYISYDEFTKLIPITEEEWNRNFYVNSIEYLRKTKYLSFGYGMFSCYFKVKEIIGEKVKVDRIDIARGILDKEDMMDVFILSNRNYFNPITEEEWNKIYEKVFI